MFRADNLARYSVASDWFRRRFGMSQLSHRADHNSFGFIRVAEVLEVRVLLAAGSWDGCASHSPSGGFALVVCILKVVL